MGQNPMESYTLLLADAIYRIHPQTRHHLLHIGGNSSSDLLKRIESECVAREQSREIKRIFLSVGMVDSSFVNGKPSTLIDMYKENIGAILGIAKRHAETVVVPGLTRINEGLKQPFSVGSKRYYGNEHIASFDNVLREECARLSEGERVRYIPLYDVLTHADLADGIHPNKQGHEKIFRRIVGTLTR